MNTDLLDWDEDQAVDSAEEYQALLNGLKRSQGFGLFFVQCSPFSSGKLIERVHTDLTDKTINVLKFDQPIADGNVFKRVNAFLHEHPSDVLFIQGLENSLAEAEETKKRLGWSWEKIEKLNWREVPLVLNNLNQQRERFRDSFPTTTLVFLLPQYAINYLVHRAPDFFDWRSGLFNYASDPKTLARESDRILAEGDYDAYCTWSEEERNQRLLEIQSLSEELDSNLDNFHLEQGLIFYAGEEYESALVSFEKAALINPSSHTALNNKGLALDELGRHEEAIDACDAALAINSDDHEALNIKGIALSNWAAQLRQQGRDEEALAKLSEGLAAYDAALAIKPDDHEALYNKGIALDELGRYEEAISAYDAALAIKPDDHEAYDSKGVVLASLARYEEALNSYQKALEIAPNDPNPYYNRACCYGLQGQVEPALENLKWAIQLSPDEYREMPRTDTDFDPIREEPRFRSLVEGDEG